ncbi:hypothetical protein ACQI4L_12515 [Mycolicibacterium litorale]|uniref:hypothetical protein n=1 Tax=Mycolicibacterium litorale TaxID=758802 RepID=UPI003CE82846
MFEGLSDAELAAVLADSYRQESALMGVEWWRWPNWWPGGCGTPRPKTPTVAT